MAMTVPAGALGGIGNTPLVSLQRLVPPGSGLFAGASGGANVVAALRIAGRLGPDATVVTILCDSGLRYLSTELYRPSGD